MRQPPGRTPPPPSSSLAPPPRRRPSGGKPGTGNGNGAGNGANAGRAAPPRPAPRRAPTGPSAPRPNARRGPNHALRRSIALAIVLTLVILVGYGAYVAYDKIRGDSSPTAASDGTGYVASVETAMSHGQWAIGMGVNFHNLKDSYVLRNQFNNEINTVRTERANLEALLPNVLGARADTVRASIQTMSELETALGQWRDAIFLLRLGNVDNAQSEIASAVAQLQQQLDTWNSQEGT